MGLFSTFMWEMRNTFVLSLFCIFFFIPFISMYYAIFLFFGTILALFVGRENKQVLAKGANKNVKPYRKA